MKAVESPHKGPQILHHGRSCVPYFSGDTWRAAPRPADGGNFEVWAQSFVKIGGKAQWRVKRRPKFLALVKTNVRRGVKTRRPSKKLIPKV